MLSVSTQSLELLAVRDFLLALRHSIAVLPCAAAEAFDSLDHCFRDAPADVRLVEVLAKLQPQAPRRSGVYPAYHSKIVAPATPKMGDAGSLTLVICRVLGGATTFWFRHGRTRVVTKLPGLIEAQTVMALLAGESLAVWVSQMPWIVASGRTPQRIADRVNTLVGVGQRGRFIVVSHAGAQADVGKAIVDPEGPVTFTLLREHWTIEETVVGHGSLVRPRVAELFGKGTVFAPTR